MIITPLGPIEIYINNTKAEYTYRELETSFKSFIVDRRFCLDIGTLKKESIVRIPSWDIKYSLYDKDSDEDFFIKMFEDKNNLILGIGINQDVSNIDIIEDEKNLIKVVCNKEIYDFKITVSWKKNLSDCSVWYACDPDYN